MEGFKKSIIAPKSETMTDLLTRITAITVGQGILYKIPQVTPKIYPYSPFLPMILTQSHLQLIQRAQAKKKTVIRKCNSPPLHYIACMQRSVTGA